jgi:hypothetical protein
LSPRFSVDSSLKLHTIEKMANPKDRLVSVKMGGEIYNARYWDTGKSTDKSLPVVVIPGLMGYIGNSNRSAGLRAVR